MFSLWQKLSGWLKSLIMKRLDADDMMETVSVTTEKVTLHSVRLNNEIILHNRLLVSYTLLRLRGNLYNEQQIKVGSIDLPEPVRVPGRGKVQMSVQTNLSHITALFNILRFWVNDNIPLQLDGAVWIKVLWWDFSLPLKKTIYIKRETVSYAAKAVKEKQDQEPERPSRQEEVKGEDFSIDDLPGNPVVPPPPIPPIPGRVKT